MSNARAIARLPFIAPLLKRWHIENRDIFELIDFYDLPTTLFYVDPPYVEDQRGKGQKVQYANDAPGMDWHRRLADRLKTIVGKAIVSSYASDRYAALFEGFRRVDGEPYVSSVSKREQREMLLCSFGDTEQTQPNLL